MARYGLYNFRTSIYLHVHVELSTLHSMVATRFPGSNISVIATSRLLTDVFPRLAAWLSRPLCEFRTYISQRARSRELQRCFIVKWCPPHVPRCTRLPLRLAYRAGQRSYVKLLRGRREEPGNEAISCFSCRGFYDSPHHAVHLFTGFYSSPHHAASVFMVEMTFTQHR